MILSLILPVHSNELVNKCTWLIHNSGQATMQRAKNCRMESYSAQNMFFFKLRFLVDPLYLIAVSRFKNVLLKLKRMPEVKKLYPACIGVSKIKGVCLHEGLE